MSRAGLGEGGHDDGHDLAAQGDIRGAGREHVVGGADAAGGGRWVGQGTVTREPLVVSGRLSG